MQFGVHLANSGPNARPESIVALAVKADELGFSSIWVSDHVVIPTQMTSEYPYGRDRGFIVENVANYYEPLTTMTYCAAATQQVRIGTCVLVLPYRNPVLTAKMIATLDAFSGGRVILGAGSGWFAEEFAALQAPPFEARGEVTDEWIEIFRKLWKQREPRHEGKHYRFESLRCEPKPAQAGGPPVWIGGHSKGALRRVGEKGDGWLAVRITPEQIAEGATSIRRAADSAKRDADRIALVVWVNMELGVQPAGAPAPGHLCGTPDEVYRAIAAYRAVGVSHMVVSVPADRAPEALERFAATVLRRFS
ncbi:MAG: LLM class F420-dependent oxidoreductase [Chloroflexi bacterium]|nr:LLM class F420-dependent oxidoreductase [Chloroflexota bacterium]